MAYAQMMQNAEVIRRILREEKFSPLAISAALARMRQESSLNPNAKRANDAGKGKDSIGIFQWNRDRYDRLEAFAKKNGKPVNDLETQARFFAREAKGLEGGEGKYGARLLNASTPEEAARAAISMARPKGWTLASPQSGHGWNNTINWTKDFSAQQQGESTQFYNSLGNQRISDRRETQDQLDTLQAVSEKLRTQGVSVDDPAWKQNQEQIGKLKGMLSDSQVFDTGYAMTDSEAKAAEPKDSPMSLLAGVAALLGGGDDKKKESKLPEPKILQSRFSGEMGLGVNSAPTVMHIQKMLGSMVGVGK